jgi:hypothetical protein
MLLQKIIIFCKITKKKSTHQGKSIKNWTQILGPQAVRQTNNKKTTPYLTTMDGQNVMIRNYDLFYGVSQRRFLRTTANPIPAILIYEEVINFYQSSCCDIQTIHHQH